MDANTHTVDLVLAPEPLAEIIQTMPESAERAALKRLIEEAKGRRPALAKEEKGKKGRKKLRAQNLRVDAIRDAGLSKGAQAGLKWRYDQININLLANEGKLDLIYSFAPFVVDGVVLLPSVIEKKDVESFDYTNNEYTRVAVSYTVDEEAVIVSAAPTYREYLVKTFPEPKKIHKALTPEGSDEKDALERSLKEGWDLGVSQADEIFSNSLNELVMDIEGRLKYLEAEALDIVKPPVLNETDGVITFNGRTMNVGEVIYTIDKPVNFESVEKWRMTGELGVGGGND